MESINFCGSQPAKVANGRNPLVLNGSVPDNVLRRLNVRNGSFADRPLLRLQPCTMPPHISQPRTGLGAPWGATKTVRRRSPRRRLKLCPAARKSTKPSSPGRNAAWSVANDPWSSLEDALHPRTSLAPKRVNPMRRCIIAALAIIAIPTVCDAEPVYLHCTHAPDNGADEITLNEQTGTVSIDGGSAGLIGVFLRFSDRHMCGFKSAPNSTALTEFH